MASMSLKPITRGLHEASHLWIPDEDEYHVDDSGAVMCTTPLQDEQTAAALFHDLSDPPSVSCRSVCWQCKKMFPSDHMLQLHITEAHDALFRSQLGQKEKVYCCMVRGCKKRFRARHERKQHQHTAHLYATEFSFEKMHLQPVKARKAELIGEIDEDGMSDDDEGQHVDPNQAFPVADERETMRDVGKPPVFDAVAPVGSRLVAVQGHRREPVQRSIV